MLWFSKGQIGAVGNSTGVKIRKASRMLPAIAATNFLWSPIKTALVSPEKLEQCWASGEVDPETNGSQKGNSYKIFVIWVIELKS